MKTTIKTNVRSLTAAFAIISLLFANNLQANIIWRMPHADSTNSGFARVNTLPALSPRVQWAGTVASGVNPVVGPDGTVYVGTMDGTLKAFRPDGSTYWSRKINPEHGGIYSSPVVSADGSVFVFSTLYRQNSPSHVNETFIHKFNSGGAWLFYYPIPKTSLYPFQDGGLTNASPNIWEWNGQEAIMIPVKYAGLGRDDVTLLAFTTYGGLIARAQLSIDVHQITGGVNFREYLPYCLALNIWNAEFGCFIQAALSKSGFGSPAAGPIPFAGAGIPMAGVAIVPNLQGGAPRVIVTDRAQYKAFYSFSMEEGFKRLVSITDDPARQFTTSPLALPDGTTVTGMRNGWIRKTQPNMEEAPYPIITYEMLTATPTRHKDGSSFVTVSRNGAVHKISGSSVVTRALTGGESIASAAASCTHVFVSTTKGFTTYDANNMYPIASYPWDSGGGFSSPVIGPGGQVYAIVGQYLFVFKGPPAGDGSTACDVIP